VNDDLDISAAGASGKNMNIAVSVGYFFN